MGEFKRFKFAFEYCNKNRSIEQPEEFYWAVKCFEKLHNNINYNHPKVRDFLKQFSTKSLYLGMKYCVRADHERNCGCEYCFLFENSRLLLIESSDFFLGELNRIYSFNSVYPTKYEYCYYFNENIEKWVSKKKSKGIVLDYLKIYSVFNSILG